MIVFTFVGIPDEASSLQRLGRTAADAELWEIPLIAEVLAPGYLNNHFGTGIFPRAKRNADMVEETRNVSRIAFATRRAGPHRSLQDLDRHRRRATRPV